MALAAFLESPNCVTQRRLLVLFLRARAFKIPHRNNLATAILLGCMKRGELDRALFQHRLASDRGTTIDRFRSIVDHRHSKGTRSSRAQSAAWIRACLLDLDDIRPHVSRISSLPVLAIQDALFPQLCYLRVRVAQMLLENIRAVLAEQRRLDIGQIGVG